MSNADFERAQLLVNDLDGDCRRDPDDPERVEDKRGAQSFASGYVKALADAGLLTPEQDRELRDQVRLSFGLVPPTALR